MKTGLHALLGAAALFACGAVTAQAMPGAAVATPSPIVKTQGLYLDLDGHGRWRSHRRWGSGGHYEGHNRWRSHRRWGSGGHGYDEHSRWRSHRRWGSGGHYDEHSRWRSHRRWGSRDY